MVEEVEPHQTDRSQVDKVGAKTMDKQTIITKITPIIANLDSDHNKLAARTQGIKDYYAHIGYIATGKIARPEYQDAVRKALVGATSVNDAANRIADVMISVLQGRA